MEIQVLTEMQVSSSFSRVKRFFRALWGLIIIMLGFLISMPAVIMVLLEISFIGGGFEKGRAWEGLPGFLIMVVGNLTLAVVVIVAGFRVAQGRRKLVLFLRRFGFEGSYKLLSYAVGTAVGRSMRLVTLDDGKAPAVGVLANTKHWYSWSRWGSLALWLLGFALVIHLMFDYLPAMLEQVSFSTIFHSILDQYKAEGVGSIMANIMAFIYAVFTFIISVALILILVGFIIGLSLMFSALAATSTMFFWISRREITKAEYAKARKIMREEDINNALYHLIIKMHRVFAPRLAVLKVADEIWRQVVQRMYARSNIVLIDITIPSEHLLWEIRTLKEQKKTPWILIGLWERVNFLAEGNVEGFSSIDQELKSLLLGEEVLVYEELKEDHMHKFTIALGAYLENRC